MNKPKSLFAAFAACLLAAAFCLPATAGGASETLPSDPAIVSGTFANGMGYRLLKNAEPKNRIYLRLVVRAGSTLEEDDQKGVAHFVEHMAFNGTAQFAKNDLIDYFESIGMSFGPEVNAYTTFDETVYMLEIPADDPAALKTALRVLKDWAGAISFDTAELDKERGVVVEEWRLGRGASGRIGDQQIPFLLNGSRYADRLPIGDPEIVKTVPRQRVVDFYQKWYRPELMTVVVVGDMDPAAMLGELTSSVATVPASAKRVAPATWPVKNQAKGDLLVIRDPEFPYIVAQILDMKPSNPVDTKAEFREQISLSLVYSAINKRLAEKTTVADPVFLGAEAGTQSLARPQILGFTAMVPAAGKFEAAMRLMLLESTRIARFGLTDAELAREKAALSDSIEQAYLDRSKITSTDRAGALVSEITRGTPTLSMDTRYALAKEILPTIGQADVKQAIKTWRTERGSALMVIAPEKTTELPSEADLRALWRDWQPQEPVTAYAENNLDRPLYAPGSIPAGKIVAEKTLLKSAGGDNAPGDITELTLSNGATVILCPTAFKANEIIVSAWSKGGTSMASDADYPSLAIARSYLETSGLNGFTPVELQKKLTGKTVNAGVWLTEGYEGVWGSSSVADEETLFQLINLQFTAPSFTDAGWGSLAKQAETLANARATDPAATFADLKTRLFYGDTIRRENLTPRFYKLMDQKRAEASLRERFADAGDFTFVFVGSLDLEKTRRFAETYLAGLPTKGTKEEAKPVKLEYPKGAVAESLEMGLDPKSQVFIAFTGDAPAQKGDAETFEAFRQLIDIRLREVVREDMSGSYGVSVSGGLELYPNQRYELAVSFGCEPGREEQLAASALATLKSLRDAPVAESYVTKLRETVRRSREEQLRTNRFWLDQIVDRGQQGRPLAEIADVDAEVNAITAETMQAFANRYVNLNDYVTAFLKPAKKQ